LRHIAGRSSGNFDLQAVEFSETTNLVSGSNGVGKTSLLEAITVLGNLRSFRASSLHRVVRHEETGFLLSGKITGLHGTHDIEVLFDRGPPAARRTRIDGAEVPPAQYLTLFPVAAVSSADHVLVTGGPQARRALLDRFVFLIRPAHIEALRAYRRAIRQRNAALSRALPDSQVAAWEAPLARAAARIVAARTEGARLLAQYFTEVYETLGGAEFPAVKPVYRTEGWLEGRGDFERVEELYQQRYNETRARDRVAGFTADGPHRHDLSLRTDGRSIRHAVSSGQVKVIATALKLATIAHIEKERRERFPVIIDDVDAELDEAALTRLMDELGDKRQVFLSSTNAGIASRLVPGSYRLHIENGAIARREAEVDE